MAEERWQVTVRVPMRLPEVQREQLFEVIADAVADWEPEQRDGWDADVAAGPAEAEAMLPAVFGYDLAQRELAGELELERASRQAWAEAAAALKQAAIDTREEMSLYLKVMSTGKLGAHTEEWATGRRVAAGKALVVLDGYFGTVMDDWPDSDARRLCACVSDGQATQLGSGFTLPVCTVHPEGGTR